MGFALEERASFAGRQVEIGLKPSAFCLHAKAQTLTCWTSPADYPDHPRTCGVGVVRPAQVRESAPRPRRPRLRVQGDTEPPRKRGKGSPFSNSI